MAVGFEMKYDSLRRHLTVTQDGNPVSVYSQFARCNSQMMSIWLPLLSGFCGSEANAAYTVHLRGSGLMRLLFRQVLSADPNCVGFTETPEVIRGDHRLRWAEELADASGRQLPGLKLSVATNGASLDALLGGCTEFEKMAGAWRLRERRNLPLRVEEGSGGTIAVLRDEGSFPPAPRRSGVGAAVIFGGSEIRFEDAEDGWLLFRCPRSEFGAFLKMWLEDQIVADWVGGAHQALAGVRTWPGPDGDVLAQKHQLLLSGEPWLSLDLPAKIEIHSNAGFRFRKLPEDLKCLIRSNDPDVGMLAGNQTIKPLKEGRLRIAVRAKEYPEYALTEKTDVYRYTEVQQVQLHASAKDPLVGDVVTVQPVYSPSNAHNISQARWSVQPAGAAAMTGPGRFTIKTAGVCTVTLTVGNVSGSIRITAFDRPNGIRFQQSQMAIKLGDNTNRVQATITPVNSRGGVVRYRVSDHRVLDLDSRNGQITPKAEGDAVITATLVDAQGRIIDDCNCNVTILPPKDVITPDGVLVLQIICIIGMVLLMQSPLMYAFGLTAMGLTVWTMVRDRTVKSCCIGVVILILILMMFTGGGI